MTRRRGTLTALAVVATIVAAVLVSGPGYEAAQVRLRTGLAWLASKGTGGAVLVDGASAELAASVRVAEPGAALSTAQQGDAALLLDRGTGVLHRVDSATHEVSGSAALLPASTGLVLKPGRDQIYGVDVQSGVVAAADPATLAVKGEPTHLGDALNTDNIVVDDGGRLWALDAMTGDLLWLADGQRRSRPAATDRTSRLTTTAGQPALVDPTRGTAELLSTETGSVTRSVRTGLRDTDTVLVGGSADRSRVLIANATRGELTACAFDTGSCADPVPVGAPGSDLGAPVEVDDHAVVPDYSTGQATIVDLSTSRVVAQGRLFDRPVKFELIARDGIVFFNDPLGNTAGVLSLTGAVQPITKYAETPPQDNSTSTPDQPAKADQAKKVDTQIKKPNAGLPGEPGRNPQSHQTPHPAASIAIRPGTRGAVGDEFELTMVLREGDATSTRWTFGDGTGAEGTSVHHRWQQTGAFTVRAISTYRGGKTAQAETTVNVDPVDAPLAVHRIDVQRPKPVIGESVHFSADSGGKPEEWVWTVTRFGQSAPDLTARTAEFDHRFAAAGKYTVSLSIRRGTRTAESTVQLTVAQGMVRGWGEAPEVMRFPPSVESGVLAIDVGGDHAMALKSDGSVKVWGNPNDPELKVPPEANSGVVAISAGTELSMALKDDGSVLAWGESDEGETNVPLAARHDVVAISAGYHFGAALKRDGTVVTWGLDPARLDIPRPAELDGDVIAISAGMNQLMALKKDGTVVLWGNMCYTETPARDVVAISAATKSCVALSRYGSIIESYRDDPWTEVPEAGNGIVSFDFTYWHGLGLTAGGSVVSWGTDNVGQTKVPPRYKRGVLAVATSDLFNLVLLEEPE